MQSEAALLPIQVAGEAEFPEDLRLRYRFLDLRRERQHRNIMLRAGVIASIRRRMIEAGFTEFQTPILTASSPEGARDYLVPSRLHPGTFYALPQAPQQFKQLCMVAGFDRYFQIAPCFRDEASRADRSPGEFYQLDFEMSFVTQEDVFAAIEPVLAGVFEEFADLAGTKRAVTPAPFPRIPFEQAMLEFGSDKPDLRNPLRIRDVTEQFRGGAFGLFARNIEKGAVVRAIPAPGAGGNPRSFFDKLNEWAREQGAGGLGYITFEGGEARGPIARNLEAGARRRHPRRLRPRRRRRGVLRRRQGSGGGEVRGTGPHPPRRRSSTCWSATPSASAGSPTSRCTSGTRTPARSSSATTPSPCRRAGWRRWRRMDPLAIKAFQYDIVCNGIELSSGAIRNHRPDIMLRAFAIAGYAAEHVEERFGGMLNAFRLRRPAARRLGAGHRPHRHAAGRRAQHPRGHPVPDEPAGAKTS